MLFTYIFKAVDPRLIFMPGYEATGGQLTSPPTITIMDEKLPSSFLAVHSYSQGIMFIAG